MIDNNIENYADWKGMAVLLEIMCGVDQIDQILLGAEMGINAKVIVNVIAVVGICVVFEHRGEPDSCAAQTGDIVKILADASYIASEEGIGCGNARRARGTARDRAWMSSWNRSTMRK